MLTVTRLASLLWTESPKRLVARLRSRGRSEVGPDVCVWCLSTGRVGTQTLARLAALSPDVTAEHEPAPLLFGLSKAAYIAYETAKSGGEQSTLTEVLSEAILMARKDVVGDGRVYIETSPQLTFLAPALLRAYPQSRFVHLVRHPADVVRSGMRRGWYAGHAYDESRIVPLGPEGERAWGHMDVLRKNIWLWGETNAWITKFISRLPSDRALVLRSEDLFAHDEACLAKFYGFLGAAPPRRSAIDGVLARKLNRQTAGEFSLFRDWAVDDKQALMQMAGEQLRSLGYQ